MATIEKITGKTGTTYRISVSGGFDTSGKRIRHRTIYKPAAGMTERQIQKAVQRAAADFERSIEQGYALDNRQTFADYAEYVLELKERTGVRTRTLDRYRELLGRINAAIGHIKLIDLRPQHLNSFYKNLAEPGIREGGGSAMARIDIPAWLKKNKKTRTAIAEAAGISAATVGTAARGEPISEEKAAAIAQVMGKRLEEVFRVEKNIAPLADKTILEHHRLISTILAQAEKEMLITYNSAAKATPPKPKKSKPDYYQPDEIDEILNALDSAPLKWKTITYLLIDTGCRRGEILGLKHENVDFDSGLIVIDHALLSTKSKGVYEGETKNGRIRALHLAPQSLELLRKWKTEQQRMQEIQGDRWVDSGYIFTQDDGSRMHPDTITDWLNKFSQEHDLPHIHPHTFRHTAASTMIANGVDLVTTANELGHANATTTAMIYAHQIAIAQARAANVRAGVFASRTQGKGEK